MILLTVSEIEHLIRSGESSIVEFKRQWFDLERAEGKATLAKSVLALANSTAPNTSAKLILGVDDERAGSAVVGVERPPEPERVTNLLAHYVLPPADVSCRHYEINGKTVSVIVIGWSAAGPHHSTREFPGILSTNMVYVRRDRTVGVATLPEIETMMRARIARIGSTLSDALIRCGFVQRAELGGDQSVTARITNLTAEPVGSVNATFDVRHARNPELFARVRLLFNATLTAAESREVENAIA